LLGAPVLMFTGVTVPVLKSGRSAKTRSSESAEFDLAPKPLSMMKS